MHVFSNPDYYDSREHVPCVDISPCYCIVDSAIPPITKEKLVDCLDNAFAIGAIATKDVINAISMERDIPSAL